jgi:murein DD-endopeptidase MepM/ murein hydrolase activator NlpD
MRKAFLRTPVEFSRVSSRFNLKRKHPVLNRIRAHKGVDYAAPRGTPVKSTSNGKIVFRGKKGGYGNTIIVKHGTKYSTLYAHLSKFRSGTGKGSRVKQGQVIGYVGSSGLATGPHLHYELRVNDVHRDPLRVKLPGAEPLEKKYREDFEQKASALIAQLDLVRNVQVASSE